MKVQSLRFCEFRQKRAIPQSPGNFEYFCIAAGGETLGIVGEPMQVIVNICANCVIPQELADNQPVCYFLRPIRMYGSNQVFFPCRGFRGIFRKKWNTDLAACNSCQFLLPRPPLSHIDYYEEDVDALRRKAQAYLDLLDNGGTSEMTLWQHLKRRYQIWIKSI